MRAVPDGGGRGRRRDPELETRIHTAALAEYGRTGWAAFTMDGVARRAGVGKSSVYLRWSSKEELLADALNSRGAPLRGIDTGSFAGDAVEMAVRLLQHFLDPCGWASVRVAVDAIGEATVGDFLARIQDPHEIATRRMVERAIARGELTEDAPIVPFMEALYGGLLIHMLGLPPEKREAARANLAEHVRPLMLLILTGAGLTPPAAITEVTEPAVSATLAPAAPAPAEPAAD